MSFLAGCGSGQRFKRDSSLVPVSGTVTIDGEPTSAIWVIFATAENVKKFQLKKTHMLVGTSGVTNDKGEFSLTTTFANDGIAPGDYTVAFEWMPSGVDADFFSGGPPPAGVLKKYPKKLLPIHEKYSAGKEGNVPITIKAGKAVTDLKFELTTKK